jgi:hypothetical protein
VNNPDCYPCMLAFGFISSVACGRYVLLLRRMDRPPMSHGAAAELTFADAIPHRYKSSMVVTAL